MHLIFVLERFFFVLVSADMRKLFVKMISVAMQANENEVQLEILGSSGPSWHH